MIICFPPSAETLGCAIKILCEGIDKKLDRRADYIMPANTQRWIEMGAGKYGPMKALILR